MSPRSPEEICRIFQRHMREGDLDGVLSVYDAEVVFVNQTGESVTGRDALRHELMPFVSARAVFEFDVNHVVQSGDIALMHTAWTIAAPRELATYVYAIEVARRQPDGTWRWLIGDPFTVRRNLKEAQELAMRH